MLTGRLMLGRQLRAEDDFEANTMVNTAMDTTVRARLDAVARPGTWPTTMATSRDIDYWRTVNKGLRRRRARGRQRDIPDGNGRQPASPSPASGVG
jgi:hypothetical protein